MGPAENLLAPEVYILASQGQSYVAGGLFISSKQCPGDDVFSRSVARELSSALIRFTSEFGMVSGGAKSL